MDIPWYYGPVIFLGALLIVLSLLVFLHWLAQFWLDNQEKDNPDDVLDSDDSEFESPFEKHLQIKKNRVRRKRALRKVVDINKQRGSIPKIEILKAASETSSVSDKSVKIRSKTRLAVSLSIKHSELNMLLSGVIKGVTGLQFPGHGGPNKIRFKMNLDPKRTKKAFKTSYYIPLDAHLIIPFQFKLVPKNELKSTVLHLKLYGKMEKFGLPFGAEHCFGEAFVSLADLATSIDEINIVQEIIPLGSKSFHRESLKIRVSEPRITTRKYEQQQIEVGPEEIEIYFNEGGSTTSGDTKKDRASSYIVNDTYGGAQNNAKGAGS